MQEAEIDFEKLLMEAVDESLTVLPKSGREMLFFHLERSFSLKKHDIPKKPEIFATALEQIFGAGALILEKLIVKNLYSKLGLEYKDRRDLTFADCLKGVINAHLQSDQKDDDERPGSIELSSNAIAHTKAFQEHDSPFMETQK